MGIFDKIKEGAKDVFGGKDKKKKSSPDTSKKKSKSDTSKKKSSSGNGKSSSSGSYDPSSGTYTDPSGQKQSRRPGTVPEGTKIDKGGKKSKGSSSGDGSYDPSSGTYTDPSGQKQSRRPGTVPEGTKIDKGGKKSKGSSSGDGSYDPSSGTYTDPSGQKQSRRPGTVPEGTKISKSTKFQQDKEIQKELEAAKQQDKGFQPTGMTKTKKDPIEIEKEVAEKDIQTEPYVERRQTGTFKGTPTYKYVYVDPTVEGKQKEREATKEEIKYFKEQTGTALDVRKSPDKSFGQNLIFDLSATGVGKYIKEQTGSSKDIKKNIKDIGTGIKNIDKKYDVTKDVEKALQKDFSRQTPVNKFIGAVSGKPGEWEKAQKEVSGYKSSLAAGIIPTKPSEVVTTAATAGIGAGIGGATRLTEKGVRAGLSGGARLFGRSGIKAGKFGASLVKGTETVGGTALGGAYVFDVGKDVSQKIKAGETEKALRQAGGSARNLAAFGVGYGAGKKGVSRAISRFKGRGAERVPVENLVEQSVLTGQKRFPEAGKGGPKSIADMHKKLFKKGKYIPEVFKTKSADQMPGIHLAPQKLTSKSVKGPLHISSQASVNFLKVQGGRQSRFFPRSWKELFEPTPEPAGYVISPKKYTKNIGKEITRGEYVWQKQPKPGEAQVPGTKREIQAVFEKGTKLQDTGDKAVFRYEGYDVPLKGLKAYGKGQGPGGKTVKTLTTQDIIQSSEARIPSSAIITPSTVGGSGAASSIIKTKKSPSYSPESVEKSITKSTRTSSDVIKGKSSPSVSSSKLKSVSRPSRPSRTSDMIKKYSSPSVMSVSRSVPKSRSRASQSMSKSISRYTSSLVSGYSRPTRMRKSPPGLPRIKLKGKKTKKKSTEAQLKESKVFVPGFTAKALGIRKQLSGKELERLSRESIGLRAIPTLNKKKNKKKKGKKK